MKTKELIAKVQKADPSGELEVVADGNPIYLVQQLPAFFDGPLHTLVHNEDLKDRFYSIIGYKIMSRGKKVSLRTMGLEEVIYEDPDIPVEFDGLPDSGLEFYQKKIKQLRKESREVEIESELNISENSCEQYFLSQDNSCHWYLIPVENRADWDAWCNLDEDNELSWSPPSFARRIDGPHRVIFTDPQEES